MPEWLPILTFVIGLVAGSIMGAWRSHVAMKMLNKAHSIMDDVEHEREESARDLVDANEYREMGTRALNAATRKLTKATASLKESTEQYRAMKELAKQQGRVKKS